MYLVWSIFPQYGDKEVLQYAIPQVLDKKQPSKVTQLILFPPEKCWQNTSSSISISSKSALCLAGGASGFERNTFNMYRTMQ